jgi:hypothetical protein
MSSDRYEARAKQIVKFAKENEPVARASSEMARDHIGNLFGEELVNYVPPNLPTDAHQTVKNGVGVFGDSWFHVWSSVAKVEDEKVQKGPYLHLPPAIIRAEVLKKVVTLVNDTNVTERDLQIEQPHTTKHIPVSGVMRIQTHAKVVMTAKLAALHKSLACLSPLRIDPFDTVHLVISSLFVSRNLDQFTLLNANAHLFDCVISG